MIQGKEIITNAIIPVGRIENSIFMIRGHRIILDSDLAVLYGVTTTRLNQQVKRNIERFPDDFMFQLTSEESESLRLKNATSNGKRGGRRYMPFAFTEHGAIMAASVLNTHRAVEVSVFVVRAFVKLRETLSTHKELVHKLTELEHRLEGHDEAIQEIVEAIHQLMQPSQTEKQTEYSSEKVGFRRKRKK
jgi:phage regulator Rha-like protein